VCYNERKRLAGSYDVCNKRKIDRDCDVLSPAVNVRMLLVEVHLRRLCELVPGKH
jgi:hypothetical protein